MKAVFTICSNNYLAQAFALGESLSVHNSDWQFYVILVDKQLPTIDYAGLGINYVLEVERLGIHDFQGMAERYSLVELCTS
ncbi:MAG: hypothetical protein ACKOFA_06770, partial [Rhodoluna sp.]